MNTILCRLKEHFPFVTRRAARETDFFRYCEKHGVNVHWKLEVRDGVYVYLPFDGSHHIFLNPKLYGSRLLHVMFHELGHQMFHMPSMSSETAAFDGHLNRRNHAEAEAVAAYLLITPDDMVNGVTEGKHLLTCRIGELYRLRFWLWQNFDLWAEH